MALTPQTSNGNHEQRIAEWLDLIGMGQYCTGFEAHGITLDILPELTDEDLKECGVAALGHRRIILRAAGEMPRKNGPPSAAEPDPRPSPAPRSSSPPPAVPAPAPGAPSVSPASEAAGAEAVSLRTVAPAAVDGSPEVFPPRSEASKRRNLWAKILASKFLLVSILAHLIFGVGATYFIVQRMSGGRKLTFHGGPPSTSPAKRALEHQVSMAKKQKAGGAPPQARRIATAGLSKIALPEMPSVSSATTVMPNMMSGLGGAGMGQGVGVGNGVGGGMGTGGGGGGMTMFGIRGGGPGLRGSFYDLKQTRDRKPSGINANNYTAFVRKWVGEGMKESELSKYFKAPTMLAAAQFMIPDMPADEAPKAYGVEKEVKPAQWLAVYRGKVQPPREGTYHFIGAADDVLLVKVNGKLVLDACWEASSPLKPEAIIPPQYTGFPRKGYIKGEGVHFGLTDWAEMEVAIGERPGGHFWAVLMVEASGEGKGKAIPLFRTGSVKLPPTHGKPFPDCDLSGPLWRIQAAGGGSLLDALKR